MEVRSTRFSGFTLIELLLVVGVITILSGIAIVTVTNTREATRVSKLESDVATINAAIQVYTVNGGSLPTSASAPQAILDKLKTRADATTGATVAGLRGNMVDLRLMADTEAPSTGQPRALWNATSKRFVIATTGDGTKNFLLDDAAAATAPVTEARTSTVKTGEDTWVWTYADVAATARGGPGSGPGSSTAPAGTLPTSPTALQLSPPDFSQAGGPIPLFNFDISLTLSNPNPPGTSQIFYSVNGAPMTRYDGQTLTTTPGMSVSAQAKADINDPDHWSNSTIPVNNYTAIPVTLSVSLNVPAGNLTYAQAGGAMTNGTQTPSPATVTLNSAAQIPSVYLTSSKFQVYYTLDGTSPLASGTAGPAFTGTYVSPSISVAPSNWGGGSSLAISAAARAIDTAMFANSVVVTSSIGITVTALSPPTMSPSPGLRSTDVPITISPSGASNPVGARIYYTLDGTDPGNTGGNPVNGILYTGTFLPPAPSNGVLVVTARVYGPAGYGQWFTPSSSLAGTYSSPTTPEGALVGNAQVNGTFVGSLIYTNQLGNLPGAINFNSGATIRGGNVYLPGTPTLNFNGNMNTIIQGRQFQADGTEILPNTDTSRVVDLTGSTSPAGYTVTFNSGSLVEGKVYRRYTPPNMPTVTFPSSSDPNNSNSANISGNVTVNPSTTANVNVNSGTATLLPGNYGSLNVGGTIVLGTAGGTVPTVYNFQSLNLNSPSSLVIVGPVILTMKNGLNVNGGATIGSSSHPEWLQLNLFAGDFNMNSGAVVYAKVVAPNNTINLNGTFNGSVAAKSLIINGSGIALTLPPVVSGG